MKYLFKNKCFSKNVIASAAKQSHYRGTAFSLIETVAAVAILAIVCSTVMVVINRCVDSTANSIIQMQAFEVARENMEKLLVSDSASNGIEYDYSEKYPEIQWQKRIETFYDPLTKRMWAQAVCSAEYIDTNGDTQTVELTHWLTGLTEKQIKEIKEAKEKEEEMLSEQDESEEPNEPDRPEEPNFPVKKDDPFCNRNPETMTPEELIQYLEECLLFE